MGVRPRNWAGTAQLHPGLRWIGPSVAPQEPRSTLTTPIQAAACLPASRGAFWLSRGPPIGHVQEATNSWLYVPLLHAAAADLTSSAVKAWRADPRAADWWGPARRLLATSSPVAPNMLADAVRHATEAAPSHAHHLSDLLGRLERAGLPNSALVHVGWAVRQLCEQDGYLIATVQEALLQCYGGEAFALAVDRHADRFRQRPRSPPSRDASPPPAAPAAVPDARDGCDAAAPARHGCERRDASAAPAGTLTARQHLPRRRRGARGSGAAAPQPGPPAPEEDHAASASDGADIATAAPPANSAGTSVALTRAAGSWLDGLDLSAEFRNPVPTLQTVPRFLIT
ncbi:GOR, partial [Symbiodinium sp. KB8]